MFLLFFFYLLFINIVLFLFILRLECLWQLIELSLVTLVSDNHDNDTGFWYIGFSNIGFLEKVKKKLPKATNSVQLSPNLLLVIFSPTKLHLWIFLSISKPPNRIIDTKICTQAQCHFTTARFPNFYLSHLIHYFFLFRFFKYTIMYIYNGK